MEKPILFSSPMVRAILDAKKTQTRRIINPQPALCNGCQSCEFRCNHFLISPKPIWTAGDTLWVRETWAQTNTQEYIYAADYQSQQKMGLVGPWKPSIHMPRVASRLTLEVVEVRIE